MYWGVTDLRISPTYNLTMIENFTMHEQIRPVHIGMDLSILRQLILHDRIQEIMYANVKEAELIINKTVTNNNWEIVKILDTFAKTVDHQWWETILGLSSSVTGVLNLALCPVVVMMIGQVCLGIASVVTILWMCT